MKQLTVQILTLCATLSFFPALAQEAVAVPAQAPASGDTLNDLLALRAKLMIEAHKMGTEINKLVNDPTTTSPEIEALRKKIEDLQNEVMRAYDSIRKAIEKLPETKEKRKQIAEKEKQIEDLNKKIDARTNK